MKKYLLLLILFSAQVLASQTFLSSYKIDSENVSFNKLLRTISLHAQKAHSTALSVGESHMHSKTALKINEMISTEYFQSSNKRIVTCLETLSHFDQSSLGQYVYANSFKTKVFQNNSPAKTDFANCFERRNKNYFVYSGFFHQYPFARSFPKEFPKTPVTEQENNNILSQMKKADILFVTQMELEYLEFTATKSLITYLKESGDIEGFVLQAKELISKTKLLLERMEPILKGESIYSSKSAIVLSQDHFSTKLNGANNYFVITNLDYRGTQDSLAFLKSLINLSAEDLKVFTTKISKNRLYMTTLFQTPNDEGKLPTSSYGGPAYTFKGNTYILHIIGMSENILLTFSPGDTSPHCLDYDSIQQVNCF